MFRGCNNVEIESRKIRKTDVFDNFVSCIRNAMYYSCIITLYAIFSLGIVLLLIFNIYRIIYRIYILYNMICIFYIFSIYRSIYCIYIFYNIIYITIYNI